MPDIKILQKDICKFAVKLQKDIKEVKELLSEIENKHTNRCICDSKMKKIDIVKTGNGSNAYVICCECCLCGPIGGTESEAKKLWNEMIFELKAGD